jgi:hypothetical protein
LSTDPNLAASWFALTSVLSEARDCVTSRDNIESNNVVTACLPFYHDSRESGANF